MSDDGARHSNVGIAPLSGLVPVRQELHNGAVIVAKRTETTPAVSISIALRAGTLCDPHELPGAMHLLSKVLDRGTAGRSAADIAEDLDGRGISLTTGVTRHLMTVSCTCLVEDFEPVLALMTDVVRSPTVPETELATRKGEVITSIRQDEDNPAVRAVEALMELLYPPPHPYGRRVKGTVESVDRAQRQLLLDLHAQWFAPNALTAVIVGDIPESRAVAAATSAIESWRAVAPAQPAIPPVVRPPARQRVVIPMMAKSQTDIAYGFTTMTRADPEYYALWLANNVFGQYALGGRLGDNIRERQGMAYYVSSSFDPSIAEGPLMVRAGVNAANVDRTIRSIDEEVRSLVRDGITEKELFESRRYLIGSLPRALETNESIAQFLQTAEFFGLGLDYDVRLPSLLEGVTAEAARAAARRYLDPDRAAVVIAGPYEDSGAS